MLSTIKVDYAFWITIMAELCQVRCSFGLKERGKKGLALKHAAGVERICRRYLAAQQLF